MKTSTKTTLPLLYMLGILALSSIHGDASTGEDLHLGWVPPQLQNLLHIPLYGILAAAWLWATAHCATTKASKIKCIACLCITFAIFDESYQTTVPGRYGSATDATLDIIGICLGLWLTAKYYSPQPIKS